jgi:hypothetical protein
MRKIMIFTAAWFAVSSSVSYAQTQATAGSPTSVEASTNVNTTLTPENTASSQSGGNVFDFSSSGGRNTPPGPSLPSFAGGPCMGVSGGISAAGPGFALGAGRSFEDEACQRRNWVQTLIGVSQHMPEAEANELKRVAITLMMQDDYLAPAFAALGYDTANPRPQARPTVSAPSARQTQQRSQRQSAPPPQPAQMAQTCVTVVPASVSPEFMSVLRDRGCNVQIR